MRKLNEQGSLLLPIILSVLLVGALGFGGWAFMSQQDYKNNSDKKSATAVAAAEKVLSAKKDVEFAEKEKNPLKSYSAPSAYGSLTLQYPKTWSAYIIEKSTEQNVVDGYMFPSYVPNISDKANLFALRFRIVSSSYDKVVKTYDQYVKSGKVTTVAYQAPKVTSAVGVRLKGSVIPSDSSKQGTMVLLPLRDKTIQVWTEGDSFQNDFTDIILANLTFVP